MDCARVLCPHDTWKSFLPVHWQRMYAVVRNVNWKGRTHWITGRWSIERLLTVRPARCSHSLFEDVAQNSIQRHASGLLNLSETWSGGDSKHSSKIDWFLSGSTAILILHEYWSRIQPSWHLYSLPTIVMTQTRPVCMDTTDFQSHNFLEC
jgi:hypothetical protein